nr:MAG TPA: hypothetical protein [Herelleviridae sp.]
MNAPPMSSQFPKLRDFWYLTEAHRNRRMPIFCEKLGVKMT